MNKVWSMVSMLSVLSVSLNLSLFVAAQNRAK